MHAPKPLAGSLAFILCAWVSTASAILVVFALYRSEDKPDLLSFLQHFDGTLLIGGVMSLLCSTTIVTHYWIYLQRRGRRPLRLALVWNILPLILIITLAEVVLRVSATETPTGTMLWGNPLAPRRLPFSLDNSTLEPLLSFDPTLGWTVAPNSSTSDGLYISADEGRRVSKAGIRSGAENATCRIALLGDSHTFGLELQFEETWGYLLERHMPECQVLNFGVSGYSLGQMYLRYKRDVLPFQPDIVILALSSNSTNRTMGVYGLTMFSNGIPWAHPRLGITGTGLTPINQPLPRLEEIRAAKWVSDLPYIDYDRFYIPGKWELKKWLYLYNSYLFRLYVTRYSLGKRQPKGDSTETVNQALLRAFVQTAESSHSIPLLLYLPDKNDEKRIEGETPSLHILHSSGFDYLDLRPCLSQVSSDERFIPTGDHYSVQSTDAIAVCVMKHISSLRKRVHSRP